MIKFLRYVSPCMSLPALVVLSVLLIITHSETEAKELHGPLTHSKENPRYFFNAQGEPVYLTGSHTWNSLVDMGAENPPRKFDFSAYLDFLQAHNHNFVRLWAWEVPHPDSSRYSSRTFASPLPWKRTGPETDIMGEFKFDLTQPNQGYYSRLHQRVAMAADRHIWVSVMLFEGWAVQFAPGKETHPFNRRNNINGVHYGESASDIHTLKNPAITRLQEAHVRNVVDAVNEFDNVLYEIVNEAGRYSTAWQKHMLDYLRTYQASKHQQHPVGITYQYPGGMTETLFNSSADWISPGPDTGRYRDEPAPAKGAKVIIADTDHLGGSSFGNRQWVWKSFMRGLNPIFMDRYVPPDSVSTDPYPRAREVRSAMGLTRLIAEQVDLHGLVPRTGIVSSGYALAGNNFLSIYQTKSQPMFLDLREYEGTFHAEWLNPRTGKTVSGKSVHAGEMVRLVRPKFYGHDIVLLLRQEGESPILTAPSFKEQAEKILDASYEAVSPIGVKEQMNRAEIYLSQKLGRLNAYGLFLLLGILIGGTPLAFLAVRGCRKKRH